VGFGVVVVVVVVVVAGSDTGSAVAVAMPAVRAAIVSAVAAVMRAAAANVRDTVVFLSTFSGAGLEFRSTNQTLWTGFIPGLSRRLHPAGPR